MTDVTPDIGAPGNDLRRRRLRLGFIALTVVSALVLATVGGLKYYVHKTVVELQTAGSTAAAIPGVPKIVGKGHLVSKPKAGQPFTVLILGTDSRKGTSAYGTEADACGCSDTIILARVNPQTNKVSLLSIPRDTRVNVTGAKNNPTKINSAYGKGSDNTVATIEADLNIDINHWIVLDLAGFKSIVDAIGGIKMDFPTLVTDKNAGLYINTTGCQKVDGTTALAISRSRELKYLDAKTGKYVYDNTYEYGRARREQILMKVIAAHTVKKSLSNPLTARSVISTFTSDNRLAIDNQVSGDELINLVGEFAGFNASTMQSFTLPTYTSAIYDAGAGKKLDFEILQTDKDVATIQAWYAATLATPKATPTPTKSASVTRSATPAATTSSSRSSSSPAATTSVAPPTGTPTNLAPTTVPPAGSPTPTPTVEANAPHDFDPRPCS